MAEEQYVRCIICPLGCRVSVVVDDCGAVKSVNGHQCKDGKKYALDEYKNSVRVLTATILTSASLTPLLPVRSSQPMPKTMLMEGMRVLAEVTVKPPVRVGDVIISRFCGTEADLVATGDLEGEDNMRHPGRSGADRSQP